MVEVGSQDLSQFDFKWLITLYEIVLQDWNIIQNKLKKHDQWIVNFFPISQLFLNCVNPIGMGKKGVVLRKLLQFAYYSVGLCHIFRI